MHGPLKHCLYNNLQPAKRRLLKPLPRGFPAGILRWKIAIVLSMSVLVRRPESMPMTPPIEAGNLLHRIGAPRTGLDQIIKLTSHGLAPLPFSGSLPNSPHSAISMHLVTPLLALSLPPSQRDYLAVKSKTLCLNICIGDSTIPA